VGAFDLELPWLVAHSLNYRTKVKHRRHERCSIVFRVTASQDVKYQTAVWVCVDTFTGSLGKGNKHTSGLAVDNLRRQFTKANEGERTCWRIGVD
jgi:hypothetical protein